MGPEGESRRHWLSAPYERPPVLTSSNADLVFGTDNSRPSRAFSRFASRRMISAPLVQTVVQRMVPPFVAFQ